ncbi:MAG: hypothetical protein QOF42_510 [Gammaproteobacteria bacterium]|nr:hypothetical protein [Gammaproteobacteria bacterium]
MNITIEPMGLTRAFRASLIAFAATVFAAFAAHAGNAGHIVVVPPSALPAPAREYSEAMMLHETASGRAYLYIEQEQGSKLAVLDVTNVARIKAEKVVALNVPGPFDFVGAAGSSTELIRFRGTGQQAVLDLHKAKTPTLDHLPKLTATGRAIPLGDDGQMFTNQASEVMEPAEYQIVDSASPTPYRKIANVKGVKQEITNSETGTTFLLAEEGLFIVRRPALEASLDPAPTNSRN